MMKFWIMMIVRIQRWLTRAEEQLDAKMTNIALDPAGDTLAQAEKINALSDRKRRLVNLAVLYHRLECALSADAWARVETCAAGETLAEAAAREGVSRTTVFRRQRMAFKKAQAVLDWDSTPTVCATNTARSAFASASTTPVSSANASKPRR